MIRISLRNQNCERIMNLENLEKKYRGADLISRLPDDILINILSRLFTKEAVRTCVLATRWKNLWKSIYNLDFSIDSNLYEQYAPIYTRVLELLQSKKIQCFSLYARAELSSNPDFDEFVGKCTAYAVGRNVCELTLDTFWDWGGHVTVPKCLLTCASLVKLTLKSGIYRFDVPDSMVCFPNLKSLDVLFVIDKKSDFQKLRKLLRGCPVLEDLSITTVSVCGGNVVTFELILPALKTLCIYEGRDEDLEYNAPNTYLVEAPKLENLDVSTEHSFPYFKFRYAPYLDQVSLQAEIRYLEEFLTNFEREKIVPLLSGIRNTRYLSMGDDAVEVLRVALDGNSMPMFPNLIELGMESVYSWKFLQQFLTNATNLQTLIVSLGHDPVNEDNQAEDIVWLEDHQPEDIVWVDLAEVPPSLSSTVKRIHFNNVVGNFTELVAIRYLLKHGNVCESFFVQIDRQSEKAEKIQKLILDFAKSPTLSEIRFL